VGLDILSFLVAGAGASYAWWSLQGRRQRKVDLKQLESAFDPDAQVVLSVALHEMQSRQHPELWTLHLAYGLMQDEGFTGAIRTLGGDPDAVETKISDALEQRTPQTEGAPSAVAIINRAHAIADHTGHKITNAHLWVWLHRHLAPLVDVDSYELAFLLVHGMKQTTLDMPGRTDVHVLVRNDDHTTMEFVTWVLREVFDLSEGDAHARMMETHTKGSSIVGRFKLPVARDKVIAVRAKAREQGFPLWIDLEDC
jgi:ATP-dependent Clp protease adaptor protein ClpS